MVNSTSGMGIPVGCMFAKRSTSASFQSLLFRRNSDGIASYGWDWGPALMTTGPWKPIKLHIYDVYLADVDIRIIVSEALDVKLSVVLLLSDKLFGSASIALKDPSGDVVTEKRIEVDSVDARAEFVFVCGELQLWYPVQYGKQPIYSVILAVSDSVSIDDPNSWYH